MKKIRVGVVGIGHLGSIHARKYLETPGCEITALCDKDIHKTKPLSEELKIPAFDDYRRMFGKVDAVSIAVPTLDHYKVTNDFLDAGIHALVEKPFTTTLRQADLLIKKARKRSLVLQVGHVERFNSAFNAVSKIISKPLFIECHRLSPFPNRSLDIGVVLDLMIHDIDIILGLVHSKIKKTEAVGVNVLTRFEDIANARITFANGCVCNLTASRVSEETMRKIRIFLKDTYISLDYRNEQAFIYTKKGTVINKEILPIEKEQPLKKELQSFIGCVRNGTKPVVSGEDAREALSVAFSISGKIWKNPLLKY